MRHPPRSSRPCTSRTGIVAVLIPAIVQFAEAVSDNIFGILTSGLGIVFDVFTIAMLTFSFAANVPRLTRAIMRRMPPERQQVVGWVLRTSIEQTGGSFYSRLLLMIICGGAMAGGAIAGPMGAFMRTPTPCRTTPLPRHATDAQRPRAHCAPLRSTAPGKHGPWEARRRRPREGAGAVETGAGVRPPRGCPPRTPGSSRPGCCPSPRRRSRAPGGSPAAHGCPRAGPRGPRSSPRSGRR